MRPIYRAALAALLLCACGSEDVKRDRQASFSGGEISPALYGRTDTPRYFNSLKRLRNWLVTATGRAVNRAGTQFLGVDPGGGHLVGQHRLIPFVFGGDQSYAVHFTGSSGGVIRFVRKGKFITVVVAVAFSVSAKEGEVVLYGGKDYRALLDTTVNPSPAATWSSVTTYALNDVAIYTSSSGDIVIYQSLVGANLNHVPASSPTQWKPIWRQLPFSAGGAGTELDLPNNTYEVPQPFPAYDLTQLKYVQSGDTIFLFCKGHPIRELKRYADERWTLTLYRTDPLQAAPTGVTLGASVAADATHPAKNWSIVVTAISADGSEESKASTALTPGGGLAVYAPDRPATYTWTVPGGAAPSGSFIYRGQGGVFGYIGQVGAGITTFRDDGQDPDYQIQPPTGRNPFDTNPSVDPNRNPQVGTLHQQRLVAANSPNLPATQWHTRLGQFHSFDRALPSNVADSFDFTLASRRFEEIRWMISLRSLLIGTSEGEWTVDGVQQEPPNPNSIDAQRHSDWGSSWVDPVVVGDSVLYITNQENHLREFIELRTYPPTLGRDLSLVAQHLFEGHGVVDMAYTRTPLLTVWLVRDDGKLLALSYIKESQQIAWSWHDTDGTVLAVCAIPEGKTDALYLVVSRNAGVPTPHIERLSARMVGDRQNFKSWFAYQWTGSTVAAQPQQWRWQPIEPSAGDFLDDAVAFDGTVNKTNFTSVGGPGAMTIVASTAIFDSSWVGAQVIYPLLNPVVTLTITSITDSTHAQATASSAINVFVPSASYQVKRKLLPFQDHLSDLATVTVVADGVLQNLAHTAGQNIVLASVASKIVVGRRYTQQFGLLPYAHERADMKTVARTLVEMIDSDPTGLTAGQDYTDLKPIALESGQVIDPATGTFARITSPINFNSKFDRYGEAVLQQTDPRPVEIIGIIRELNP